MSASHRIKRYPACEAIDLERDEIDAHYRGSGEALAQFVDGRLAALHYVNQDTLAADKFGGAVQKAGARAIAWLHEHAAGETYIVMCSCSQLCEPRLMSLADASAIAHMMRRIGDDLRMLREP